MEYMFLIWILASFAGASKRWFDREANGFLSFLQFIGEFLAYPIVKAYEEFGE